MMRLVLLPIVILLFGCNSPVAPKNEINNKAQEILTELSDDKKELQSGDRTCLNFKEIKFRDQELLISDINFTKQSKNMNCHYSGSIEVREDRTGVDNTIIPFRDSNGELSIWTFWKINVDGSLEYQDYLKPIIDGKGSEITKWDLVTIGDNSYFIYIKYWGDEGLHNKTLYLNKVKEEKRLNVYYKKTVSFDHDSEQQNDINYTLENNKIKITETIYSDQTIKETIHKEIDLSRYNIKPKK